MNCRAASMRALVRKLTKRSYKNIITKKSALFNKKIISQNTADVVNFN